MFDQVFSLFEFLHIAGRTLVIVLIWMTEDYFMSLIFESQLPPVQIEADSDMLLKLTPDCQPAISILFCMSCNKDLLKAEIFAGCSSKGFISPPT
jgi:hypothetical protein